MTEKHQLYRSVFNLNVDIEMSFCGFYEEVKSSVLRNECFSSRPASNLPRAAVYHARGGSAVRELARESTITKMISRSG